MAVTVSDSPAMEGKQLEFQQPCSIKSETSLQVSVSQRSNNLSSGKFTEKTFVEKTSLGKNLKENFYVEEVLSRIDRDPKSVSASELLKVYNILY